MEYAKSLEDEIDFKVIDQLHAATLSFSSASIELKKLYFVLVGIGVPSLIKLSKDQLNLSLFISIYLLTITFWLLDSFTYYYQDKLRKKMNTLFLAVKNRNYKPIVTAENISEKEITIEVDRTAATRFFRSLFNVSLLLYLLMFILTTVGLLLFQNKVIA